MLLMLLLQWPLTGMDRSVSVVASGFEKI